MSYPNDFINWCRFPYHENYTDQYVKTMQSDEFHYYKLNWAQIIRPQQIIFQQKYFKCITENSPLYFDQTGTVYIYGDTSKLESYKSTE